MKRLLPIFLMALLVGACGAATPSESPSITPSESPVAEVTPTPTPTPTPAPVAPAGLFTGATSPVELTAFDLATPVFIDTWWAESCEMFCSGKTPEIASDGTLLYFAGSTGTPVTDENDADYNYGLPPAASYRLFVYDPTDGSVRSAAIGKTPFGLGTPIIPGADENSRPTFLAGACLSDAGKGVNSSEFYRITDEILMEEVKKWPFTTSAYFNGQSGALGVSCAHYNSPSSYFATIVDGSPYLDDAIPCTLTFRCDRERSAAMYPGAWTDLYQKGHPAPVCPPEEPKCKLSDRINKKSLTGEAYGPVGLYETALPTIAFYATRPSYDGGGDGVLPLDELRYYDQASGKTGSVLLEGKPLFAMTSALFIGGQVYMAVTYRDFTDEGSETRDFSTLVRIDPANPGVATAITIAP